MTTDSMVGSFTVAEVGSLSMGDLSNNQSINQSINSLQRRIQMHASAILCRTGRCCVTSKATRTMRGVNKSLGALVSCPVSIKFLLDVEYGILYCSVKWILQ